MTLDLLRFVLSRLLWMLPTLFGISLLTFLLIDLVPIERAAGAVAATATEGGAEREARVRALQLRYGMIDPETGAERSVWSRYGHWLSHALRFDFGPDDESPERFRHRFRSALAVSCLLGLCAAFVAIVVGTALGVFFGRRTGGLADRLLSGPLLGLGAQPEFLTATLLLLAFGGALGVAWLPSGGLRSPGSSTWTWGEQGADFLKHLVLPVATLALAPTVSVMRYLRESVARVDRQPLAAALRAYGMPESAVEGRVLRHALGPLFTLLGTLLPSLIAGSVVVEQVFGLPGFGRMAFQAVLDRDVSVVMATTLCSALLVMVGLLVSDLLHARSDPRVVLR